jgi:hypothetical protein
MHRHAGYHFLLALMLFTSADAFSHFSVPMNKGIFSQVPQSGFDIRTSRIVSRKPLHVLASSASDDIKGQAPAFPIENVKNVAQAAVGAGLTFGLERGVAMGLAQAGLKLPSAPIGKSISADIFSLQFVCQLAKSINSVARFVLMCWMAHNKIPSI